jgi:hypothetical protein
MRPKIPIVLILLLALLSLAGLALAAATQTPVIDWRVTGGGGGHVEQGIYSLDNTLGQPVVGSISDGSNDLCAGFWCSPEMETGCTLLTGVSISGPTKGVTATAYSFVAAVIPSGASAPITYTWSPAPDSGQDTATVAYTWTTTGTKTISVTVSNCSATATASDTHDIDIGTFHMNYLPVVLRNLT